MDTARLEEKIYTALKAEEQLMELLPKGESSIFRLQAPTVYPDLPFLVYSLLSDTPSLFADNKEYLHRTIFRLHIVTGDNDYSPLYSAVKNIMQALGFIRVSTTPFIDSDGVRMLIADFKILTGA